MTTPSVPATLHVVATPIGNRADLSPRAIDTLRAVSAICAEDTRHTRQLLAQFGIDKPLVVVTDESTGELVYTLRLAIGTWQPHTFGPGKYKVTITEPETGKLKELAGLEAKAENNISLEIIL